MASFWKEELDPSKHRDFMSGFGPDGGAELDASSQGWVFFVRECGFTFQFVGIDQLERALRYFSSKTHESSRVSHDAHGHWYHRWYERLPAGLVRGSKRERIRKALERAYQSFLT